MIQRMPLVATLPTVIGIFALCWLSSPTFAQPPSVADRWAKLEALQPGTQVRVELTNGDRQTGVIEAVDTNRLTFREQHRKSSVIERDSVRHVTRKSRKRGALYGLLVGFGAGFALGAAAGPYITDYGNPGAARRVKYGISFGAFIGGIGAGVGALAGTRVSVYP